MPGCRQRTGWRRRTTGGRCGTSVRSLPRRSSPEARVRSWRSPTGPSRSTWTGWRSRGSTARQETVRGVLDDTFTDAFAVLQGGELAAEWYAPGGGPDMVHAVLSVTKSLVGCVAGILLDRGVLDENEPAERVRPRAGLIRIRRRLGTAPAGHAQRRPFPRGLHGPERRDPADGGVAPGRARALRLSADARRRASARRSLPLSLHGDRRPGLGVREGLGVPHGRADRGARLGAHGRRQRRGDHVRPHRHR